MMGTLGRVVSVCQCQLGRSSVSWHWWALTCHKGEADLIFVASIEASPITFLLPYGETEA